MLNGLCISYLLTFELLTLLNLNFLTSVDILPINVQVKINPNFSLYLCVCGGGPHGIMVKTMDSGIVVSEFELKSHYYIHFRTNTLGKGMKPLILPAMG